MPSALSLLDEVMDRSTGYVRQVLRASEAVIMTDGLHIETSPGLNGRAVTVVTGSVTAAPWTDEYAVRLAGVLLKLPGADVIVQTIRDRITVVWDGFSPGLDTA